MSAFLWLMLIHLLYDFHIQGDFIGQLKSKYWFLLFVHAATWALVMGAGLQFLGLYATWKVVFLFVTHFIIDAAKCRGWWEKLFGPMDSLTIPLWLDQTLHVITILIVM